MCLFFPTPTINNSGTVDMFETDIVSTVMVRAGKMAPPRSALVPPKIGPGKLQDHMKLEKYNNSVAVVVVAPLTME